MFERVDCIIVPWPTWMLLSLKDQMDLCQKQNQQLKWGKCKDPTRGVNGNGMLDGVLVKLG